jgi:hypothetical protein
MSAVSDWTRRHFFGIGITAALVSGCSSTGSRSAGRRGSQTTAAATAGYRPAQLTALSLAVLQDNLSARPGTADQSSKDGLLPGLNRITAFLMEGNDVILVGYLDTSIPAIELDALAVSLRNAFGTSDEYEGVLGCTIDPRAGDDPWRIQDVRVFGMPHDCSMAARHVSVDYELKKVSAGLSGKGAPILASLFDRKDIRGMCQTRENRSISLTHRYWFFPKVPDRPRFAREESAVSVLHPVGVQLLTEREFLNRQGKRVSSAQAEGFAADFAASVTALLGKEESTQYAQLVQDFRLSEIAKLMRFVAVPPRALAYFLEHRRLGRFDVPRLVGGVERDEQGSLICETTVALVPGGVKYIANRREYGYRYRGGVEARIEITAADFSGASPSAPAEIRYRVLAARPAGRTLFWSV